MLTMFLLAFTFISFVIVMNNDSLLSYFTSEQGKPIYG